MMYEFNIVSIYDNKDSEKWNISTKVSAQEWYSVMQADGNSWKIDTFRKAITSELMISS